MGRKKILLVDDSSTARLLERMLLQREYELIEAENGVEGLAKAIAEKPDLILLDVVMPEMDGFETCRQLRQQDATRAIPIIMVTTGCEARNVASGFANGCTDFLAKPIRSVELFAKIKNCLGEIPVHAGTGARPR